MTPYRPMPQDIPVTEGDLDTEWQVVAVQWRNLSWGWYLTDATAFRMALANDRASAITGPARPQDPADWLWVLYGRVTPRGMGQIRAGRGRQRLAEVEPVEAVPKDRWGLQKRDLRAQLRRA